MVWWWNDGIGIVYLMRLIGWIFLCHPTMPNLMITCFLSERLINIHHFLVGTNTTSWGWAGEGTWKNSCDVCGKYFQPQHSLSNHLLGKHTTLCCSQDTSLGTMVIRRLNILILLIIDLQNSTWYTCQKYIVCIVCISATVILWLCLNTSHSSVSQ